MGERGWQHFYIRIIAALTTWKMSFTFQDFAEICHVPSPPPHQIQIYGHLNGNAAANARHFFPSCPAWFHLLSSCYRTAVLFAVIKQKVLFLRILREHNINWNVDSNVLRKIVFRIVHLIGMANERTNEQMSEVSRNIVAVVASHSSKPSPQSKSQTKEKRALACTSGDSREFPTVHQFDVQTEICWIMQFACAH